ncbi:MFS transporter [Donghicola mangrovi]|uniref:MFS transporter n=1 Tax=Donghicola mangrovi TaxID=2729614 RepID=A0A850QEP4_9RHOB|nr:MFS transporter [Donghicola mangrovi]NVO25418.1 MFS transporter [Donghicola mangrovi]
MADASLTDILKNRTFRALWVGGIASNLGTMVHTVGAGWLMAMLVTNDAMVSYVQAATTLPVMIFSVLSGVLADQYDRSKVLLIAQILMMGAATVLAFSVFSGSITPYLLLIVTFLLGCGTALHTPSWQASVGDVVERTQIADAVTLNSMGLNLTRSVGPAVGGVIVALFGAASAFAFNAISFIPMILALRLFKRDASIPKEPENFTRAIRAGIRYVVMSPEITRVILRGFAFGVSAISILALLPLVTRDQLSGDAMTYGILLGAYGVGALGAGIANAKLRANYSSETIIRIAFSGLGFSMVGVALSPYAWLTGLIVIPAGACWVLALSLFNVVVQLNTPRWVVGRVLSIYQTASFGGMTAGGWIWGVCAEKWSTPNALLLAAVASFIGLSIGFIIRMPTYRVVNLDPLNRFVEPEPHLEITNRSGPVRVTVEYLIPEANSEAFLMQLNQRRRVKLRDGAREWVLLRDIEEPAIWKESYTFPTWGEYLRCNQRPTQADAEISKEIRALCEDGKMPIVRRLIERHRLPSTSDIAIKSNPEV